MDNKEEDYKQRKDKYIGYYSLDIEPCNVPFNEFIEILLVEYTTARIKYPTATNFLLDYDSNYDNGVADYVIRAYRVETDEELNKRVTEHEAKIAKEKAFELEEEKLKSERELSEFLRLREKFKDLTL